MQIKNMEGALRGIAGAVVLLSLLLAWAVNGVPLATPSWLWLAAVVGISLLQSAFTGWCPMMWVLARLGAGGAGRPATGGTS